jgi:hypothetical protein
MAMRVLDREATSSVVLDRTTYELAISGLGQTSTADVESAAHGSTSGEAVSPSEFDNAFRDYYRTGAESFRSRPSVPMDDQAFDNDLF